MGLKHTIHDGRDSENKFEQLEKIYEYQISLHWRLFPFLFDTFVP